jgi:hypothetical protein
MMPFKIATTTASFRRNSEDRLASHQTPKGLVVVVADGAGGNPGEHGRQCALIVSW